MRNLRGLVLCALTLLPLPALCAEDDLSRLMPADVDMVVYLNVKQLIGSALLKQCALEDHKSLEPVKSALKDNKEALQLFAAMGLDPLRDIHSMYLGGQANSAPKLLLVIRGAFDVDKVHKSAADYLKQHPDKGKQHTDGDLTVYEISESGVTGFAILLDRQTVIIGRSKDSVVTAARQKDNKLKKELQELIHDQDAKQSLWFAGVATDDIRKQLALDPRTASLAGKVTAVTGRVLVTDQIVLELRIQTTDGRSASMLRKFLNDIKTISARATENIDTFGPFLSKVVGTFKVSIDDSSVVLSATITAEMIKQALDEETKK